MTAYKDKMILTQVDCEDSEGGDMEMKPANDSEHFVNLSCANLQQPMNDFQPSSLLINGGCKVSGLFSGDRFIPYRPEETHLEGTEHYLHEEKLLCQ